MGQYSSPSGSALVDPAASSSSRPSLWVANGTGRPDAWPSSNSNPAASRRRVGCVRVLRERPRLGELAVAHVACDHILVLKGSPRAARRAGHRIHPGQRATKASCILKGRSSCYEVRQ
jgi:hypothetical protein